MISTCFSAIRHGASLRGGIITPAQEKGIEEGRFSAATKDEQKNATAKGYKIMCVQDMGISSWDVFKIAIIGDLAMVIIAAAVCLGVGFGSGASPGVWAITVVSLAVPTLGVDYICYRISITRITDEIAKNMSGEGQAKVDLALN